MNLDSKVVLLTGGARVGAVVAESLADNGARLALVYNRSLAQAQATAERITASGGQAFVLQADINQSDTAAGVADRVAEHFGAIDILVNMASQYEKTPFEELDAEAWDRSLNVDARGAYLMALACAPHMRRAGEGRIINFADWVAASGRPRYKGYLPYHVSKSAVLGLTEALALELAPDILVNAIAPGPILPPEDLPEAERLEVERATPLGRWGGAGEIAKTVRFLIESDFVTGECIRVDGGRHLS